jgi:hypothetical protein
MQATATIFAEAQTRFTLGPSVCETPALQRETHRETASIREYGNCVQGFVAGLCLEGALALCLYGMYHIGHILR